MRRFYFLALMAVLCLGYGFLVSCSCDDDDDDDDNDDNDDDDNDDADDDDNDSAGEFNCELLLDALQQCEIWFEGSTYDEVLAWCNGESQDYFLCIAQVYEYADSCDNWLALIVSECEDGGSAGLVWQDPPAVDKMSWEQAVAHCETGGFDGHDDWRLPTISELRSLIRGCPDIESGGDCNVTDDCLDTSCWNESCVGCDSLQGPGSGGAYWPEGMTGEIGAYWSSSPVTDGVGTAWLVSFEIGFVSDGLVDYNGGVRCVR